MASLPSVTCTEKGCNRLGFLYLEHLAEYREFFHGSSGIKGPSSTSTTPSFPNWRTPLLKRLGIFFLLNSGCRFLCTLLTLTAPHTALSHASYQPDPSVHHSNPSSLKAPIPKSITEPSSPTWHSALAHTYDNYVVFSAVAFRRSL